MYNRTEEVKPTPTAADSNVTVVTAFFAVNSKHNVSKYNTWMRYMLSLQDAMVIFTSSEWVPQLQIFRAHALNRTLIIQMSIDDLPIASMFPKEFWENQLAIDIERVRHKSYQLFWIWLSKAWFVTWAVERNIFQSSIFVWSDIGCFRRDKYQGDVLVQHADIIPRRAILAMAHSDPEPPKDLFWAS
jgi:hypothetical protein